MTNRATLPYGRWPSPLSAERLFSAGETISFPRPGGKGVFFLLTKAEEGNAQVLMHLGDDNTLQRVSPRGYNLRSRVHEYGGCPYAVSDSRVYYCNFQDQRLWQQHFDGLGTPGEPSALTPVSADAALRYVDFIIDTTRQCLIAVREDHRHPDDVRNSLVSIDLKHGGEGNILFDNSDFVISPTLSADGQYLALVSWNHPDMPWDHSRLHLLSLDASGQVQQSRALVPPATGALQQPQFTASGGLCFIADWTDWWNLYHLPAEHLPTATLDQAQALCPLAAECGVAMWTPGVRSYAIGDDGSAALAVNHNSHWQLLYKRSNTMQWTALEPVFGNIDGLFFNRGEAIFCAAGLDSAAQLWQLPVSDAGAQLHGRYRCKQAALLASDAISRARHISFDCVDGEQAHGLLYPPCSTQYQGPDATLPPLLVMVHGGPTGCARPAYNPVIQFWTSRGFAVFDVNHRGSTGYGRGFRHRLYGHWGEIDVSDVIAGVIHLVNTAQVDSQGLFIRGGSAGGFVVLAALCQSPLFRAGTSYYGVSDLALLARDTHKFEARYLDRLIGPWPEAEALYHARSPINHLERMQAPVLLLQGTDDRVVPPNQAQAIYDSLKPLQPDTRYVSFSGEGHGFRQPGNQIAALEQELAFYVEQL